MGHVFISYSHKDKEYVHKLADALQFEGFEPWIDDRIDYGTRWPLVIETAIDSCDAFILVASENSHESEWVQHELARAKRLEKQVFPLLLSGSSWISFESIQYFDVQGGVLPNQKFYSNLRAHVREQFEFMRRMIIDSWPVYHNVKYGVSVSYPLDGNVVIEKDDFVQIDLPVLHGTNLQEKYMMIYFKDDGVLSSPLAENMPQIDKSKYLDIFGLRFVRESGSEGGMCRLYEWVSYSTLRENKVVTLSLRLTTFPREVFLPHLVTKIDMAAEWETLLYVLSTFNWLN